MDRRVAGAWLLVAVLVAAAVIPNLRDHQLAGTPVGQIVPAPPSPGDCLLVRPPSPALPQSPPVNVVEPGQLAPCTGRHFGEVAMVVPNTAVDSYGGALMSSCMDVSSYIGRVPPVPAALGGLLAGLWNAPFANNFGVWTGPTPLQRAAGQTWAACILVPPDWYQSTTPGYTGSALDAFSTGRLPSVFATCWSAKVVGENKIRCDEPHPVELLAIAMVEPGVAQQRLDESCLRLATTYLRRTDMTAAGVLSVRAMTVHLSSTSGDSSPGLAAVGSADRSVSSCVVMVTGPRLLRGSLVGIGDALLPWAV